MVTEGLVEIAFDCASQLSQLAALAERYSNWKPDLADLCLIRMSELYPRHSVITVDRADFRIYRRNKARSHPSDLPPLMVGGRAELLLLT